MMALLNSVTATGSITRGEYRTLLILLNPFAPHITEELWQIAGFEGMLNQAAWPEYDEDQCKVATIEIVAQVNGKTRGRLNVDAGIDAASAIALAKADEKVAAEIDGKSIIKELYVPGKLVNIVAK